MPKLLLLDGNSLLYRGYFAMRSLSTASGQPTNAIYSLAMMLLLALEREKPDAVVCAWDGPAATFRHIEFAAYKAQRAEPPEDLVAQRPLSRELMSAFNISMLDVPGWEADDIIGTLAEREKQAGNEVLIVTGDLDTVQLVDDRLGPVRVMSTIRGVTDTVIYDEAAVMNRYGLTPLQIPDYKALKGDPSDNIPGLPGIGDKTASQLIGEFGSVEALLEGVDRVKSPKQQALLRDHSADALQFKRLATISRDIEIPEGFFVSYDYQSTGPDNARARELFDRLEFRTLGRRLPNGKDAPPPPAPAAHPTPSAQGSLDFDAPVQEIAAPAAIVLPPESEWAPETSLIVVTEPHPEKADVMGARIVSVVVSRPEGGETIASDKLETLRAFLEDASIPKIVHDAKLTIGVLARSGIALKGVVFDTMLAAYLLNAGRSSYRLTDIVREHWGIEIAANDWPRLAQALRAAQPLQKGRLVADGLLAMHDEIELPLSSVIARLEMQGVAIDAEWMREIGSKLQEAIARAETEVFELCKGEVFSIGSPKQLQVVLFEKLGLPHGKKTKTGYSTDSEVLESLAAQGHVVAERIIEWRELTKLKSQYADALPTLVNPVDGRIHTTLNQTVASTGRLSSTNPNLQNIPIRTEVGREIRKGFVASPGNVLLAADYSQIELRIFAHITHDPELVRTFKAGEDIHRRTAALVFGVGEDEVSPEQRRRAKTVNFAVIYGMGDVRLAAELGVDRATAGEWKKRYFASYPGVKEYSEQVLDFARANGFVQTLLGRRRYAPDINSLVAQFRTAAEREAVNMPVQGTCADIIKLAMLRADRALRDRRLHASMILQVHDELLFECPEGEVQDLGKLVSDAMESAFDLGDVPLKVDVKTGLNWAQMTTLDARRDHAKLADSAA
ncbi:MAG: DNA polymerase I [Capsulimonadaceae bacterium]|nr:DNA polymerase I [Capsulimonadaceae bacterium]